MPTFVDYSVTFDDENGLVTFLPSVGSLKQVVLEGETPDQSLQLATEVEEIAWV